MNPDTSNVTVLLVEDDLVERRGLQRALDERGITNPVRLAEDGEEALEILRGGNGHSPLSKPYVIVLDLNLPGMSGIEFLRELRGDPDHASAIVFVRTTSREADDRARAYAYNVAGYVVKSLDGAATSGLVDLLQQYWRTIEFPL